MSRFESSKFVRNNAVMRQDCLISACEKLGWKYQVKNGVTLVTDIGIGVSFGAEYAIKVEGSNVTYNTYYFGRTGEYVQKLQNEYNTLKAFTTSIQPNISLYSLILIHVFVLLTYLQ